VRVDGPGEHPDHGHFIGGCTIGDSPDTGVVDQRPPLGAAYRRVAAVAPSKPLVPADAPGALRLPITPA